MQKEIVLQINELKKHFGQVRAVDGISIEVTRNQILGFLGPNGSGKTTTIGMILGLIHPTGGTVTLFGRPISPTSPEPLRKVGALVGSPSLVPYLSAKENLGLAARLYPETSQRRISEVLDLIGLQKSSNQKAGTFSTGMKQRLGLGMALLHQPELLILDEPTNGMDPSGMHEIRNMLANLADKGVTIFLSSHLLHEIEQICTHVAVINKGRLVAQGRVREFVGQKAQVKIRVDSTELASQLLHELPGSIHIRTNGDYVTVSGVSSRAVVSHLMSHGVIPSEVTNGDLDLETVFLELIS